MDRTTLDDTSLIPDEGAAAQPGLVVVSSGGRPMMRPLRVDGRVVFGRNDAIGTSDDERMSREHAEVRFDGHLWSVRDRGSRNGTFVDGQRVREPVARESPRVLRMGATLCLFCRDLRPYVGRSMIAEERMIAGPTLQQVLGAVAAAAQTSERLFIAGESGTGKELAARTFHSSGPHAAGRFVAVNCAAIPEGVAERLLFGAVKGAYSGATGEAEGYLQAAEGGVLFLDEVGELDVAVQSKLLRVLEHKEVLPLGAATPRRTNVRICFATNVELRAAVANRQFREDLYYRITQLRVQLPPLRERPAEISFHVARELSRTALVAHARLIETCLLRPWPGNVRELIGALRHAVARAQSEGATVVEAGHLDAGAGQPVVSPSSAPPPARAGATSPRPLSEQDARLRATLLALLQEHRGNVSQIARVMGKARMQVQRWLIRFDLDAEHFRR